MPLSVMFRSSRAQHAVWTLLVALVAGVAPAGEPSAVRIAFTLSADARRISGTVASWDFRSLEITPAESDPAEPQWFTWCDLAGGDALKALQRLIDRTDPMQWLQAGLALLSCGHEHESDTAFAQAARLDKELLKVIDTARAYREQGRDVWEALPKEVPPPQDSKARPAPPEAGKPPPDRSGAEKGRLAWPLVTDEQRKDHTDAVRRACEALIEKAGAKLKLYEAEHFLVYSDLPPADAKRCIDDLEKMNATLVEAFELPKGTNVFHGKCAVFIFEHREEYLTFQTAAFGFDARKTGGVCQPRGPMTFCSFFRSSPTSTYFRGTLVHETVHAFVYRYKSPAELPTWANEGLADLIASEVVRDLDEGAKHWNHARQFAAQRKKAIDVMNQTYEAGTWFNDDSYPISHMIVRLMIKSKPRGFKEWIDDIKLGVDWRKSMMERMEASPETLSERFNAAIMAEKRYTRIKE